MTVEEMLASDKPVLTPADIAPVLGRKPYSISIAAKDHPEQLGFPVSRIERITVIPRLSFLKFLGYEVEAFIDTLFFGGIAAAGDRAERLRLCNLPRRHRRMRGVQGAV